MKKNILIIAYAYPPNNVAGAQRPYALAKYLDKAKYNIKVITCQNPDLPMGENENFDPNIDDVEILYIKSKVGNSAGKLRPEINQKVNITNPVSKVKSILSSIVQQFIFPDKGMFWTPMVKAYLEGDQDLINNADVIFSTSPGVTNHRIAYYIKKKNTKAQWIADFRDFNYVEHWESRKGIKASLHKKLEKSIVNGADKLTFVTKTMQRAYQKFYPSQSQKMHCVYNGFDRSDFPEMGEIRHKNNKLSFFYAGSFYNGLRSPLPLLELLDRALEENLLTKEETLVQIAGNTEEDMKASMKDFHSFQCVQFLGSLPRAEVIKHMSEATFLWLIVANIKAHYQTIPIKLFEYIAARRPIVNFAPAASESSQIIQEKNLGYNFNTLESNMEETYPIFKELILKYKEGVYNQPMPGENLDSFVWQNQIKLIENLF